MVAEVVVVRQVAGDPVVVALDRDPFLHLREGEWIRGGCGAALGLVPVAVHD
jgi:hypothetical protein